MAGMTPLTQPGYINNVNTYNPSQVNYQGLNQGLVNSLSPNATVQQIQAAYAPQAQQAETNLNQTLADFGVGGGQAVRAQDQLQSSLAAGIAPALAQAIQASQGMQLGAGEFNAGNSLQAALANAGSQNQAGMFGAQVGNQANAANVGEFNQRQDQLLQDIIQSWFAKLGAQTAPIGAGQGASNQQAINYGGTITTSDPFGQIFGGLGAIAPFLGI